ncbi:transglutaminase family protein [Amphritea sp. 2_MG-2023]|uniref:transglutaminase family protein n=1 Tax=Amphritea TaxID=515417 RepID=UPI001C0701DE|nr:MULTISPECIES: transglutaminase family protein [Amphritea]MBU2964762.1 transglutaminase family protein [Amphritea atlantica]MDO6417159.1 transglutaminase family protein [Amphritea sp. 2_MG-2023]
MAIRTAIHHITEYRFDKAVEMSPHTIRLRPAAHSRTPIKAYSLKVSPENHFINWQQDPFGNFLARIVFPEKSDHLRVEVEVIADMTVINPFDFFLEEYAEKFPFKYEKELHSELKPYLEIVDHGPLIREWVRSVPRDPMPMNDFLVYLNQRLEQDIDYNIRMEPGVQSGEETLQLKRGSCRDTAWLLVQILRHLGLAARFASGYLVQLVADVKALDGPSGTETDFTDLHAWCEVFIPGAGWIGLDPTSGLFAGEGHIPLACTPSPRSAAPIAGGIDPCEVEFSYSNEVVRIHEDPRVTKPYTEEQWAYIEALGEAVDQKLVEQDVRLTMGGEPTFVSIDDMDGAQWNTEALGEAKLSLAKDLLFRLRDKFAPGGLLHYGQGKWYPGEEVPRWALGCFWRTDGQPLWREPKLLARVDKDYGVTRKVAKKFAKSLAKKAGLATSRVIPAYEDTLYYLWKEQSLPDNVDPLKADLKDDLERKKLAQLLSQGLEKPVGFCLPLGWDYGTQHWRSSPWPLRRDTLTLIPGDSPIGLRLPLNSLPVVTDEALHRDQGRDPFAAAEELPEAGQSSAMAYADESDVKPADKVTQPVEVVRTTLCIEPRNGCLFLFLPPLEHLEHYIALIELIEDTAAEMDLPVVIEGYEAPKDDRLRCFKVTPDPGVIEVNIHPSDNWRDLSDNTQMLYEEARLSRLGAEKFMLDGRHTGTGGGNHITLGAATAADSPFLRRPDLLRSFVTFWQHHPGLSYLFSGMFIGPTSQAPRVDEGREEMLYELETAFDLMPDGIVDQPWLIDRLMRNLLVDITGNTHRSEFCIDKLYSPGLSSGRQGLLEFRGFEMPPHPQMALVQALLIRCLMARFWEEPYKKPLVRWGTDLHDRFMMPHYVWADIREVVKDLQQHGIPFQQEWLAPFEEFRFPHYGSVNIDDVRIELRWAIEPWHVLGEEVGSFGTARFVDSSVERLQVKVEGLTPDRYVLACNGRRLPLRSTGQKGEFVAAVRYKAWAPQSALHPTIGVHSPLIFDLIDTWNGQTIGGCSYHVVHPGGRSYETFPVNAFEAESRRINRFGNTEHTPTLDTKLHMPEFNGLREFFANHTPPRPMAPPQEMPTNEYPHTLDLRRQMET